MRSVGPLNPTRYESLQFNESSTDTSSHWGYCWIAEINGDVIGFISGSIRLSEGTAVIPAGKNYIEIDNVYVSVQFRRQGIGSRLVDQLLAQAKQQSVAYALLYSATKDVHAVLRFYEQHSFQSWYVQMFRELWATVYWG